MTEKPFNRIDAESLLRPTGLNNNWDIDDRGILPKAEWNPAIGTGNRIDFEFASWRPAVMLASDPLPQRLVDIPALPFPFDAQDLAAFMLYGFGALVADHYGDWENGPAPERINELSPMDYASRAIRDAFAAYREAQKSVDPYPLELDDKAERARKAWNKATREKNKAKITAMNLEMEATAAEAQAAKGKWLEAMVRRLLTPAPATDALSTTSYRMPMHERLEPVRPFLHDLAHEGLFNLEDAAKMASRQAELEITQRDFIRAAAAGKIVLHVRMRRDAMVQRVGGGVYCNIGQLNENIAPLGALVNLPMSVCEGLVTSKAVKWRTFDSCKMIDGLRMVYTAAELQVGEPDMVAELDDCFVTGYTLHALADAFRITPAAEATELVPHILSGLGDKADSDLVTPENLKETSRNGSDAVIGMTTREIGAVFYDLPFKQENWPKRVTSAKWLHVARLALGAKGGASAMWCPLKVAQAIHNKAAKAAKARTLKTLNNRFQSNPTLKPWRGAWDEFHSIFSDSD
jgi:hypothetical protein